MKKETSLNLRPFCTDSIYYKEIDDFTAYKLRNKNNNVLIDRIKIF